MANAGGIDLKPGDLFARRYEVVRQISVGGMGAVYEAVHLDTKRRRALKIMRPELLADESARARFKLEAQVAATIESEHIVEVVDAGVEGGVPFIVMELLRGEDLGALLTQRGRLSPGETVELLGQAARALDRTHAAGIVHRDLKPENLFLTEREDGSPRLKVLDFGIAKVLQENRHQTHATASIGTPVFMAPEQISGGRLGPTADTYALGHIAYNLLCGAAYWDTEATLGNVYNLLLKIPTGPTEPALLRAARSGVALPAAFEAWFARAVAVAPEMRFQSAGELVVALANALGVPAPGLARAPSGATVVRGPLPSGMAVAMTEYGATMPLALATKAPPRRGGLLVAGALAFLALGGTAAYLLFGSAPSAGSAEVANPMASGLSAAGSAQGASGTPAGSGAADPKMSVSPSGAVDPPRVEPAPKGAIPAGTQATATATATATGTARPGATTQPTSKVTATPKGTSTGAAVPPLTGPAPTNPLLTR